ncbi:hypothetical protein GGR58DRAFT_498340 [Xylaria digitata]|nr:hypothetical protein GGR58DRAFT_498340 [Xylaria digitata]
MTARKRMAYGRRLGIGCPPSESNRLLATLTEQAREFKFDVHGFELINFELQLKHEDFNDFREKNKIYTKEIEEYFKNKKGFAFVEVYDLFIAEPPNFLELSSKRSIFSQPESFMLSASFNSETHRITRVRKPLNGPVRDWLLAVCDYSSCNTDDIVDVDQVYPDAIGEGCNICFNKNHKWFFASDQVPHEALLLKQLDSRPDAADYKSLVPAYPVSLADVNS